MPIREKNSGTIVMFAQFSAAIQESNDMSTGGL